MGVVTGAGSSNQRYHQLQEWLAAVDENESAGCTELFTVVVNGQRGEDIMHCGITRANDTKSMGCGK